MKLLLAICLLALVAGSNCQAAYTLENCLYAYGLVIADLAFVKKDLRNAQYIAKAKSDVATLKSVCTAVINSLPKVSEEPENLTAGCDTFLQQYKIAVKTTPAKALPLLQKYHACLTGTKSFF